VVLPQFPKKSSTCRCSNKYGHCELTLNQTSVQQRVKCRRGNQQGNLLFHPEEPMQVKSTLQIWLELHTHTQTWTCTLVFIGCKQIICSKLTNSHVMSSVNFLLKHCTSYFPEFTVGYELKNFNLPFESFLKRHNLYVYLFYSIIQYFVMQVYDIWRNNDIY